MKRLEVCGAVRPIYGSLGFKRLREGNSDSNQTPMEHKIPEGMFRWSINMRSPRLCHSRLSNIARNCTLPFVNLIHCIFLHGTSLVV